MVVGGFGGSYNSLSFNLWDLDLEGGLKSGNGCLIKGGSICFCVSCFLLLLGAIDQFLMVKSGVIDQPAQVLLYISWTRFP